MGRQIITVEKVEEAVAAGATELQLSADAIVTDNAADRARERGIQLRRGGASAPTTPQPAVDAALAAKVRSGVISQLGHVPAGLDAIIDRVVGK